MTHPPITQTLQNVFSGDNVYVIPSYQRKYAWGVDQASEMFDDIDQSEGAVGGFMGTMIFEQLDGVKEIKVVDGQQRLTTFTILLMAIRGRAQELGNPTMAQKISEKIIFTDSILGKAEGYRFVPSIKVRKIFQHMASIEWDGLPGPQKFPDELGGKGVVREVNRIRPVYDHFKSMLSSLDQGNLTAFAGKAFASYFYIFRVSDAQGAMELFERTNARGLRLEVSDLIKTELFSLQVPDMEKKWDIVESVGGDSPSRLLKYFYYTQGGHVTKKDLFKRTRDLPCTPVERLDRICSFAQFFQQVNFTESSARSRRTSMESYLRDNKAKWLLDNSDKLNEVFDSIMAISSFGITQHTPLLFGIFQSAFRLYDRGINVFDKLLRLVTNLERYHYVNTVICEKGGNETERLYAKYAKEFCALSYTQGSSLEGYNALCVSLTDELLAGLESFDSFKAKFAELTYEERESRAALMYAFDRLNNLQIPYSASRFPIFRPFEDDIIRKVYTIEHIVPQNPTGNTLPDVAVHQVGNLVVLSQSVNSKLSNKSFEEKMKLLATDPVAANDRNLPTVAALISEHADGADVLSPGYLVARTSKIANELYFKALVLRKFI